jgi:hypothetical protein
VVFQIRHTFFSSPFTITRSSVRGAAIDVFVVALASAAFTAAAAIA